MEYLTKLFLNTIRDLAVSHFILSGPAKYAVYMKSESYLR